MDNRYRIGIDLGGTNIKAGIVDRDHKIIASASRKTRGERHCGEVLDDMAGTVKDALQKAGISLEQCESIGIGSPGTIDHERGIVIYSNNIRWEQVRLAEEIKQRLSLPVKVANDANCAALGEALAGSAKGCKDVVLLTLGTGVGGGVIIDGKLFQGGIGGAELGHTTLIAGGELCTCGRRGCVEAYCSATALIREADRAAEQSPQSLLRKMREEEQEMNGRIPFDAMKAGDKQGTEVVEQYIQWLGEAVTNYVNIFRPQMVLLSGGICGQGALLTEPLKEYVKTHAFAGERLAIPDIAIAKLGNDAGIIGAANLQIK